MAGRGRAGASTSLSVRGRSAPVDIGTLRGSDLDARPGVFDIALIVLATGAAIATSLTLLARQAAEAQLQWTSGGTMNVFHSWNGLWALVVVPAVWASVLASSLLMWRPVNRDQARLALLVTIPIPLLIYLVRVLAAGGLFLESPTMLIDMLVLAPRATRSMYFFALIPVAIGAVLLETMPSVRNSRLGRLTTRTLCGATFVGVCTAYLLRSRAPTAPHLRWVALVAAVVLCTLALAVLVTAVVDRRTSATLRAVTCALNLVVVMMASAAYQVYDSAPSGREAAINDVIAAMAFVLIVVPIYALVVQSHDYVVVGRSLRLPPAGHRLLPADVETALRSALRSSDVALAVAAGRGQQLLDSEGRTLAIDPSSPRCQRIVSGGELVGAVVWAQRPPDRTVRVDVVIGVLGPAVARARVQLEVLAQLTDLTESRRRVAEAEIGARRQLERDLHDGAQQRLTAALIMLKQARHADEPAAAIDDISMQVQLAIDEIHALSRGLNSPALISGGLFGAIDELIEAMPIAVRTDVTRDRFDPVLESAAFFAIREGLTNVLKHAESSSARVVATRTDDGLRVLIADDGVGGADIRAGTGLLGLRDRVEALGGQLVIDSSAGSGTQLRIELPRDPRLPLHRPFELEHPFD